MAKLYHATLTSTGEGVAVRSPDCITVFNEFNGQGQLPPTGVGGQSTAYWAWGVGLGSMAGPTTEDSDGLCTSFDVAISSYGYPSWTRGTPFTEAVTVVPTTEAWADTNILDLLNAEGGALVSVAIVSCWAFAWAIRSIAKVL